MKNTWAESILTNVEVIATFPDAYRYIFEKRGSKEYYAQLEKNLKNEITWFKEFLLDHHSQNLVELEQRDVFEIRCRHCGYVYDGIQNADFSPDCCIPAMAEYEGITLEEYNKRYFD
jgi:hypothetical protein